MEERDYRTYLNLFKHMSNFMCRPNLIVFLDLSPETSMERILMRSRDVESNIPMEYLRTLHAEYKIFIENISRTVPVIKVGWEQFRDAEEMAAMIEQEYFKGSFLREVEWGPTSL